MWLVVRLHVCGATNPGQACNPLSLSLSHSLCCRSQAKAHNHALGQAYTHTHTQLQASFRMLSWTQLVVGGCVREGKG